MQLEIRKPDDFHLHLRDGDMLANVLPLSAAQFARATVMPNLSPKILTAADVESYRARILSNLKGEAFEPLMTLYVNDNTTPEMIAEAKKIGTVAGKVYPKNMTTGSDDGVSDFNRLYPVVEAMQECGMLLLLHGEDPTPNVFCLKREELFLPILKKSVADFPRLNIVFEHVSSAAAVSLISELPDTVAATITVHHLILTLDDVIGGMLKTHHFCKPIAKTPKDRNALLMAALSGNPKFFFGSDSAPHAQKKKEASSGMAGIFTAPVALPLLADLFEQNNALEKLESFVSQFGAECYGLPLSQEKLVLEKKEWTVPLEYGGVVPFKAGETLNWHVVPK
ncbi:dihydroorotase [Candidatus Uhrbacteria bacterium]|nr:dihydroorotase [Candidatus Uhrbacteria bacterium]